MRSVVCLFSAPNEREKLTQQQQQQKKAESMLPCDEKNTLDLFRVTRKIG